MRVPIRGLQALLFTFAITTCSLVLFHHEASLRIASRDSASEGYPMLAAREATPLRRRGLAEILPAEQVILALQGAKQQQQQPAQDAVVEQQQLQPAQDSVEEQQQQSAQDSVDHHHQQPAQDAAEEQQQHQSTQDAAAEKQQQQPAQDAATVQSLLLQDVKQGSQGGISEGQQDQQQTAHGPPTPRILIRYTACTGLINQYYSHIAAFALASTLHADLVLPTALCRDSFEHRFSMRAAENQVSWSAAPLETLMDVETVTRTWEQESMRVMRAPQEAPLPNMTNPSAAYPNYSQPGVDPRLVGRLEGVYLKPRDLDELVDEARRVVARVAQKVLEQDPGCQIPYVVLDLPCTMFAVRSLSALPLISKVALSLKFSPYIEALADKVVRNLTGEWGQVPFNGAHLRLEKDARDWQEIMGGSALFWHYHVETMQRAGFNRNTQLYVASGLLSYGAQGDWRNFVGSLLHKGLANAVKSKESFLPERELNALNSEQKALLDLLVLSRAQNFVGFGASTFSYFLREYRMLLGMPRTSTALVNASRVGTDDMFNQAAVLAPA